MNGSRRGFTLIEVSIVMVVIGILATIAVNRFNKIIAFNELEKTSFSIFRELSSMRSVALSNDTRVFVKFSTSQCSLFIDLNDNGKKDAGEFSRKYDIAMPVTIGIAEDGPLQGPEQIDYTDKGIAGNWKNAMEISNNANGSINSGAIYLKTSKIKKMAFCIGISGTMQSLKLFGWDGSKWNIQ